MKSLLIIFFKNLKERKRHKESEDSDSDESDDEFDEEYTCPLHTVVLTFNKYKQMVRYISKTGLNRKIEEKGGQCLTQENQTRWLSLHATPNNIDRSYDILIIGLSEMNMLHFPTLIERKILKGEHCIYLHCIRHPYH